MTINRWISKLGGTVACILWIAVIAVPLVLIGILAVTGDQHVTSVVTDWPHLVTRSMTLAAAIAAVAVLLGLAPAQVLSHARHTHWVLGALILPLVLPRYVLYYAWTLLLSPTGPLGSTLSQTPDTARTVAHGVTIMTLALWYWPLAALLVAQAQRLIDRDLWDIACLEAAPRQRLWSVTVPMMWRPAALAFAVCFLLVLSEFTTFHLSGLRTVGSELAVVYELTGSTGAVARAAVPLVVPAMAGALALTWAAGHWQSQAREEASFRPVRFGLILFSGLLWCVSIVCPVILLLCHVRSTSPFVQFLTLHMDDLVASLGVAITAAVVACVLSAVPGCAGRLAGWMVTGSLFLVLFLPASVMAVALLKMVTIVPGLRPLRMSWVLVAVGQGVRFAGVGLLVRQLLRSTSRRDLREAAALDGASGLTRWWHVDLPCTWPVLAAVLLLIMMFSLTELSATMVLLPPGVPNFAQRLLNQMHYARDEHVIASCLILVGTFSLLTTVLLGTIRCARTMGSVACVGLCMLLLAGCDPVPTGSGPEIVASFGQTGKGPGQFMYPRAIESLPHGGLVVIDKTGRIQTFDQDHHTVRVFDMPEIKQGKPTGLTLGPDGNLYVADTHYSQVCVYTLDGHLLRQFGEFGEGPGCFIYPTDVAFAPDGRIYVGEYGGHDRISVFDPDGEFLTAFGTWGSDAGQLSRPAALRIDPVRKILYVADACNHRIALYDLDGHVLGYWGEPGQAAGQLRYPYDLELLRNGDVLVCEYGNNRLQRFSPDGQSLGVYGRAGRNLGELAYPWGVTTDAQGLAYVVDAGNNRIQVWKL
ncbi:MAG: SMP-30/gluconolactonase/LRE family protein [Phycisphaerae bacterium]|nr:SMP-30/gluconolactonase/LRE family protein [Phycisphaerae bacterium]